MAPLLARILPLRALSQRPVAVGALGAVFLIFALRAALAPIADPDVWWVAAAGRDMLATGHVPTLNRYSFVDGARPWVMHEWLFAVPYAVGLRRLGPAFFALVGLGGAAVTCGFVLGATVGRCRHLAGGAALGFLVLGSLRECLFAPRPGYVALAFAAAMARIALAPAWNRGRAAAAITLEVLWANAHGSFPVGVALLVAGVLAAPGFRRQRSVTAALALAATLANPYGLRLHGLVERYVRGTDPALALVHANIVEFGPLWQARWPFVNAHAVVGLVVVLALAASALGRGVHRARALLVLVLAALAVLHARHLALCVLVGAVAMAPWVDDLLDGADLPSSAPAPRRGLVALAIAPGLLAGLLALGVSHGHGEPIAPRLGGAAMVRLARELAPGQRVWVPFESAGLVLWLTAPAGVRVLLDPRNDCYSAEVLAVGFGLENGEMAAPAVRAALDHHGVDRVLVPDSHPVARALLGDPNWRVARRDGTWTLRARREPPALGLHMVLGHILPVEGFMAPGWSLQ